MRAILNDLIKIEASWKQAFDFVIAPIFPTCLLGYWRNHLILTIVLKESGCVFINRQYLELVTC